MSYLVGYTQFEIGDLVCLSAYGEAREYNVSFHGHWGIVTGLSDRKHYPYQVMFVSKRADQNPSTRSLSPKRTETL